MKTEDLSKIHREEQWDAFVHYSKETNRELIQIMKKTYKHILSRCPWRFWVKMRMLDLRDWILYHLI